MGEKRLSRAWPAAATLFAILAVSACSVPLPEPTDTTAVETETPRPGTSGQPVRTAEPETVVTAGSGMSFADGTSVPSDAIAQWADGFLTDENWELTSPDDGQGNWGYTSADGTCVTSFWQGNTAGVELTGDDRADSDLVIATLLGADPARVTEVAQDTELSYLAPGSGGLDARVVESGDGERIWRFVARSFSNAGAAVTVMIDCTGGDIDAAFAEVYDKNAVTTM